MSDHASAPLPAADDGDEAIVPFAGQEPTLIGGDTHPPIPPKTQRAEDKPSAFIGAEATVLADTRPDAAPTADAAGPFTGADATLVGPGTQSAAPQQPFAGDEMTMVGGAAPAPGPAAAPATAPFVGDEATMVGAALGAPYAGNEMTMVGAGGDATQATIATDLTPKTFTGRPRSGTTSTGFDAGWHLEGRKGPHTGQMWGDFELGGILGEGGMGAVYRGIQLSLKRRVAVKVLPPNLAQDERLLERFRLEAGTSSRLQSPHIVQVYFIGEHDDNHFYTMEYVEGTDLSHIARERREADDPLRPEEAVDYILQSAKGLAEAGRLGIVHRDIKPPNMMVTKDGLLKLADFGIVKVMGESSLTMTGQAVGTPAYVSPEQGKGLADIDQRSDLYSLGVVFYELACGKRPFEATTPNALIYKHCFEEPELPQKLNPAISNEIQAMIMRCLQKKPENRYQSADELVRDLEMLQHGSLLKSALANYKLGTGADEAKREQMTWFQRHILPLAGAALLVIGAGVASGWWWMEQRQEAQRIAEAQLRDQERASDILRPALIEVLDRVASLPEGIDEQLNELELIAPDGAADSDLVRWRAKVAQVRTLADELSVLDSGIPDAATRATAVTSLDRYAGLVGTGDAAASRWGERLQQLARREEQVRNTLAELFASALTQTGREAAATALDELGRLASADDPVLMQGRERLRIFDEHIGGLLASLAVLDDGGRVTEGQRQELLTALGQLAPLLGEGDARVQRWRTRLEAAGDLLGRLRGSVTPVFANTARPALPAIEAIEGDLDLLAQLVGEDDAEVTRWRAQAANSRRRAEELRTRLGALHDALPGDGVATAAQLAAAGPRTEELAVLAGPGDEQVAQWQLLLRDSRSQLNAWQTQLNERLDPGAGHRIGLAEHAVLQGLRQRLVDKAAADLDRIALWDERLRQEAQRVADLRRTLADVMDAPQAFTTTIAHDLEQFLRDTGSEDEDARRWAAKATRIRQLRDELAVLDERRSVPDGVVALFDRLALEVGDQAPEIQRWQEKVRTIERTLAALAPLDQPASLPEDVDVLLARLARLVGDDDAGLRRYSDRVARVRELSQRLERLGESPTLDPDNLASAHEDLHNLIALVGIADATAVAAARRVMELDGPPVPSWAEDHGRDEAGRWAAFSYAGSQQRMRYIAPGTFIMGSPANEPGRDDDETAVAVRLSRGYWLAETEVTQNLWASVTGFNPSRFRDPERPVERVSRSQALAFIEQLGSVIPGLHPRLPSEAEWEMAARAGHNGRWWLPPGDTRLDAIAWYAGNSRRASQPVAGRYPNALGLYDMHGNVSEWVADSFAIYPTTAVTDPLARGAGQGLARGGAWGDPPASLRAANRIPVRADMTSAYLGLRLAASAAWGDTAADGSALLASADPQQQQRELRLSWGPVDLRLRLPRMNGMGADSANQSVDDQVPSANSDSATPGADDTANAPDDDRDDDDHGVQP